jgi:DNA-binding SARP family transcriptional activator
MERSLEDHDMAGSASALIQETYAVERSGDIGGAFRSARQALDQARASGDTEAVAAALNCHAFLHFRLGHYEQASVLSREALSHAASVSPARADALLMLGMCAAETDDLAAGEDLYRSAIDLSRQLGCARTLFRGLHNLSAGVYMARGQFELALAADQEALRLAAEHSMPEMVWAPSLTIAWIYWLTGQVARLYPALEALRRAAAPGSQAEGYYYCMSGNLALEEGTPDRASPLYSRARSIAESVGTPDLNIWVRLGLSRYHRAIGDSSAAQDWANDAWTVAARVGYRHMQGIALLERGRAAWQSGDSAAAEADLREAIEILYALGTSFDLARARLLLAALLHEYKDQAAAAAWESAARSILDGNYAFLLQQERVLAFPLTAEYLADPDPALATLSASCLKHLQRVPPPPLHVVTLGRFELWQGARHIEKRVLCKRHAGELFALLLLNPTHRLTFDQIAEAFWHDRDPLSARVLFHNATSSLRRALEPELPDKFPSRYLTVDEGEAMLCLPPGSTVDIAAFEEHCAKRDWEAALALYGGDLLPDWLYADWAAASRERFRAVCQRALVARAQARLAEGHFQEALDDCRRVLEIEPWQEQAVHVGMRAALALNDLATARRLYRGLEKRLREELHTSPQEELQVLFRSLAK